MRSSSRLMIVAGLAVLALSAGPGGAAQQKKKPLIPPDIKEISDKTGLTDIVKDLLNKAKKPTEWEKFDPLSPDDPSYEEDYSPPGMPEVPLACAHDSACEACFTPAYDRLRQVRIRFEKLRRVYAWTKAYNDRALALGDGAAGGMGTLAGLAWITERVKIEKAYKRFEAAYDNKYAELVDELKATLDQMASCEAEVYGEEDWYNRFGFIYFQFMADRYRR